MTFTTEAEALRLIHIAIERASDLTYFGFGVYEGRKLSSNERRAQFKWTRAQLFRNWREVAICTDWLRQYPQRKTINRIATSYGLKHRVEAWGNGYVSNGAFIAAALGLGFEFKRVYDASPNAWFNIGKLSIRRRTLDFRGIKLPTLDEIIRMPGPRW